MFIPTAVLFFLSDKFNFNTEKVRPARIRMAAITETPIERLGPRLPRRHARILPLLHLPLHPPVRPGHLPLAQGTKTGGK